MVPKISGTRLSFDSKSSVAPVDCQTYSGLRVALVPDLAEQHPPADLRVRVVQGEGRDRAAVAAGRARRPSAPSTIDARPRRHSSSRASVRSDVWWRRTSEPSAPSAAKLRSRGDGGEGDHRAALRLELVRPDHRFAAVGHRRAEPARHLAARRADHHRVAADQELERRDRLAAPPATRRSACGVASSKSQ